MTLTRNQVICLLVLVALVSTACGAAEEQAPPSGQPETVVEVEEVSVAEQPLQEEQDTPELEPAAQEDLVAATFTTLPVDPPDAERTLQDSDSSLRAYENRTIGVDKFLDGLYERPFTSTQMDYMPQVDIISVDVAADDTFFYFTIRLFGMDPVDWGLTGAYGIEFDRNLNGRGEVLVLVEMPGEDWSADSIRVFEDTNGDVGGPKAMIADAGFQGNGYETLVEMADERAAFARIDPQEQEAIQIAVSRALLDDPQEFLWSAWAIADLEAFGVELFDFNDRMGPSAAGSPLRDDANYPIKELFGIDNTCRLPFGFAQAGNYPGMCKIGAPIKTDSGGGGGDGGGGGVSCPPGWYPCEFYNGCCPYN